MWLAFVNQNYKNSLLTLLHEQEKELKSGFISYSYSSVAIT